MRFIHKGAHVNHQLLTASQQVAPTSDQEATSRWGSFSKDQTYEQLLREQYGLCAYTELDLTLFKYEMKGDLATEHYKGAHIEHIEPKSRNPTRTFDYRNLVLCALDSDDLQRFRREDRFGGHHKLSNFDPNLFVSPLQADCGRYFIYISETGEIEPAPTLSEHENRMARYTIDLLNLNARYLRNKRKSWMQELIEEIDKLIDNQQALRALAECELGETRGRLRGFHSAAKQLLGVIGKEILASDKL
jgi:uncharacterized protein (TIGR02646 family)